MVQAKANVGQEGNYRPEMRDKVSAEKPPRVVFGVCLFARMCVHVDLFFKACVSFLFMYLALKRFLQNSVETAL